MIKKNKTIINISFLFILLTIIGFNMLGIKVTDLVSSIANLRLSDYRLENWILLLLNIVSYGIMTVALLLCIQTKIKRKQLWFMLILLQVGVTAITYMEFPNNFPVLDFSFIKFLAISKRIEFPYYASTTSVFIHIFAIVFLLVRKKLESNYKWEQEIKKARMESQQRYKDEQVYKATHQKDMDNKSKNRHEVSSNID